MSSLVKMDARLFEKAKELAEEAKRIQFKPSIAAIADCFHALETVFRHTDRALPWEFYNR